MNQIKAKSTIILACGLAFAALPCAFAEHAGKHSAEDMFKKTDINSDGKLSRSENAAGSKQMFTDADTNNDGQVTLTEMTAAHAKMKAEMTDKADLSGRAGQTQPIDKDAMQDMSAADMIKMNDTNKDGQLSRAEQSAGCDKMFDKMDTNHDASLSLAECQEGEKLMKKSKEVATTGK